MVTINDSMPSGTLQIKTDGTVRDIQTYDLFPEKRVIVFGVAGAYNDRCRDHYMNFLENYDNLKNTKGIDAIYCITVNDPNVVEEWWKSLGSHDNLQILSDGSGDYARALGMQLDMTSAHMGQRQRRFIILADNNSIKALHTEDPSALSETRADELLKEVIENQE